MNKISEIDMAYELLMCVSVIQEFVCQHELSKDSYNKIASVENAILNLANDYIRLNHSNATEEGFPDIVNLVQNADIAKLVQNAEIVAVPNGKLYCHRFPQ